jgi:vacuolar protein sorting-associated protein 13D
MQLLDSSDCAICCLSFDDLKVEYEKGQSHSATAQIALRSLQLDDLMMAIDSKHRRLVASTSSHQLSGRHDRQKTPKALPIIRRSHSFSMSSSCPNLLRVPQKNDPQQQQQQLHQQQDDYGAGSLPARLEPLGPQWVETSSAHLNQEYPKTPPSSPVPPPITVMYHQRFLRSNDGDDSSGRENLVLIKVLLIDPTSADFAIKYNSTRRFVEVDLNELDVVVNVESWVMVLDFFGASPNSGTDKKKSRKKHKSSETSAPSPGYQDWRAASGTAGRLVNSRWEVEVRSFRLLLNRLEKGRGYEVAEAVVTGLSWEMASMRGNLDVTGKLGGVLVRDLTPVGRQLYNERFVTTGNEALDFQFFRFSADDPHLARDYDIRLNINMASVLYVHTQRFYVECMSVLQQFQQLMAAEQHHSTPQQEKLEKSPPSNNRKQWKHGTRILLNVDAGSPVIVLPVCSRLFIF